jgi:hypothetical protein
VVEGKDFVALYDYVIESRNSLKEKFINLHLNLSHIIFLIKFSDRNFMKREIKNIFFSINEKKKMFSIQRNINFIAKYIFCWGDVRH